MKSLFYILFITLLLTGCYSGNNRSFSQTQSQLFHSQDDPVAISICDINNENCTSADHLLFFHANTKNYFKLKIEPKAENTKIDQFVLNSFTHRLGWKIALNSKLIPIIDTSCMNKKLPLSKEHPCTFLVEYQAPNINTVKEDILEIKYSTNINKWRYRFKAKTFPKSLPELISIDDHGHYYVNIATLKLSNETQILNYIKLFNSYFSDTKIYRQIYTESDLASYMYKPFKTGIGTHALIYIEHPNLNSADNSVITYPSTSIISSGFEIPIEHSFSAVRYFNEEGFPISFNDFKNSVNISEFELQKIGYLLAAKNIGGSPLQAIWMIVQPDNEQIMINVREANLNSIDYYSSSIRDKLRNRYHILPGNILSVKKLFIDTYNIKDAAQLQIVDFAFSYIQNPESIDHWLSMKASMLYTLNEQIFFIGTVLKISGNHYLGAAAFGGENPHTAGLILINQMRQNELFNNADIASIEQRLRVYGLPNEYANVLFNKSQLVADYCIDIIGSEVFNIAMILNN